MMKEHNQIKVADTLQPPHCQSLAGISVMRGGTFAQHVPISSLQRLSSFQYPLRSYL